MANVCMGCKDLAQMAQLLTEQLEDIWIIEDCLLHSLGLRADLWCNISTDSACRHPRRHPPQIPNVYVRALGCGPIWQTPVFLVGGFAPGGNNCYLWPFCKTLPDLVSWRKDSKSAISQGIIQNELGDIILWELLLANQAQGGKTQREKSEKNTKKTIAAPLTWTKTTMKKTAKKAIPLVRMLT